MTYRAWAIKSTHTGNLIRSELSERIITWRTKAEAADWAKGKMSGLRPVKVRVTVEEVRNG